MAWRTERRRSIRSAEDTLCSAFSSAPEQKKRQRQQQPNKFQPLNFNCDWIWQFTLAGRLLLAWIGIVLAHTSSWHFTYFPFAVKERLQKVVHVSLHGSAASSIATSLKCLCYNMGFWHTHRHTPHIKS